MSDVAGYATVDAMVTELLTIPPEQREKELRSWLGGTKAEKDKHVATVMAKIKARELQ
jgi:hypothetical protein